jgi:hypothetical protein
LTDWTEEGKYPGMADRDTKREQAAQPINDVEAFQARIFLIGLCE